MTYREAHAYFLEQADMEDELEAVELDKARNNDEGGFLQKLLSCC